MRPPRLGGFFSEATPSRIIPFLLEVAALATFVQPNHIVYLCLWGLTHLPPTCNSKLFGYSLFHVETWVTGSPQRIQLRENQLSVVFHLTDRDALLLLLTK